MNDLRTKLLTYRAKNKLSQSELAKEIGIGTVTMLKIENERPVREITRIKVEQFLEEHDEKSKMEQT